MAWRDDVSPQQRATGEFTDALNAHLDAAEAADRARNAVERRTVELDAARARTVEADEAAARTRGVLVSMVGADHVDRALDAVRAARSAQAASAVALSAVLAAPPDPTVGVDTASAHSAAHNATVVTTSNDEGTV